MNLTEKNIPKCTITNRGIQHAFYSSIINIGIPAFLVFFGTITICTSAIKSNCNKNSMDTNDLESKQLMLSWQISLMNVIQLFFNILPVILVEIMVSSLDGTLEKKSYF